MLHLVLQVLKLEEIKEQRKYQQNYWTSVLVLMFVVIPCGYVRIHVCFFRKGGGTPGLCIWTMHMATSLIILTRPYKAIQ